MNKYVIYNILYLYIMELKSDSSVIIINSIGKYSNNHPRVEFKRGDVQIGNLIVQDSSIFFGKEDGNTLNNARHNVGIGIKSLNSLTTGDGNVALGFKAGDSITVGDSNVIIGSQADISTGTGKNQIVIGAAAKGMGDSTVVLGDSLTIKTTYLHGDVDINRSYVLPKTAGTKGQVLKYPATGKNLEWSVGGGAGESEGNIQIGDSSLYTSINMKQGFQDIFYVPDYSNKRIRKVTANGVVTTLTTALTFGPTKLLYLNNNLYITSPDNNILKKLVLSTGLVTDIATVSRGSIATDGTYIYVASSARKVYQIKLDGDFPDIYTNSRVFAGHGNIGSEDGIATVARFTNLLNIICIGNNLYVADGYPGNKIRKIPINSDGTAGNVSTLETVTASAENYGGITNIGNTIYYGSDSNIYKIIIDDKGAFISKNILQNTGGGNFSSLPAARVRSRLTNDGVNLYCTKDMNQKEIFKIPINSDGIAGTIVSFVGSNDAGTTDGTGSTARFNSIHDMTGVFEPFAGKNNIAIGEKALYSNTIGEGNVAIGFKAGDSITVGDGNVAIGFKAGDIITTGDSNVIIGYDADVKTNNDNNSIVIGAAAKGMGSNTVVLGDSLTIQKTYLRGQINIYDHGKRNNIALGTSTLENNTQGKNNTAVGDSALFTNVSGDNNTAIGKNAGNTLTTGSKNICIGHDADVKTNNDSYSIVIGAAAKGMGSNTVVLGDLISITQDNIQIGDSSLYTNLTNGPFIKILDTTQTFYLADNGNSKIRKINISDSVVTTVDSILLGNSIRPVALTQLGEDLFIFDSTNFNILKFDFSSNTLTPITASNIVGTGYINLTTNYLTQSGIKYSDSKNTFIYLSHRSYESNSGRILKVDPNGNSTTIPTVFYNPGGSFDPIALVYINNHLYVTEWGQNTIKKIETSTGTLDNTITISPFDIVSGEGGSTETYSNHINKGGLTNIGTDIYFGSESTKSSSGTTGLIFKIPTTGVSDGVESVILQHTHSDGGGDGDPPPSPPKEFTSFPHRLSHDGTNLYLWNYLTPMHKILKASINGSGEFELVMDYIGKSSSGDFDASGTNAQFDTPFDMIPFFDFNSIGIDNTAIGEKALFSNTVGEGNVAIGDSTLLSNTTGNSNVAVGTGTGNLITIGDSNVIIGYGANVSSSNASNQIVIGAGATGIGNNKIAFGNTSITAIKGQVAFSTYSDIRIKKNITNSDLGLDFIKQLRSVKYNKVNPAEYPDEILEKRFKGDDPDKKPEDDLQVYHGLVAQEVKQVLDNASKTWDGHSINESNGKQGIAYGVLTVPLIKAVQELNEENTQLKADIAAIKSHLGI